jgi:hypothetical protein
LPLSPQHGITPLSFFKRHKTLIALAFLVLVLGALLLFSDPTMGFKFKYKIF